MAKRGPKPKKTSGEITGVNKENVVVEEDIKIIDIAAKFALTYAPDSYWDQRIKTAVDNDSYAVLVLSLLYYLQKEKISVYEQLKALPINSGIKYITKKNLHNLASGIPTKRDYAYVLAHKQELLQLLLQLVAERANANLLKQANNELVGFKFNKNTVHQCGELLISTVDETLGDVKQNIYHLSQLNARLAVINVELKDIKKQIDVVISSRRKSLSTVATFETTQQKEKVDLTEAIKQVNNRIEQLSQQEQTLKQRQVDLTTQYKGILKTIKESTQ